MKDYKWHEEELISYTKYNIAYIIFSQGYSHGY